MQMVTSSHNYIVQYKIDILNFFGMDSLFLQNIDVHSKSCLMLYFVLYMKMCHPAATDEVI